MESDWVRKSVLTFLAAIFVSLFPTNSGEDLGKNSSKVVQRHNHMHINSSLEVNFMDWHRWRKKFRTCSPKINTHASPVEIYSSSAENADDMQTLIIHSGMPVEDNYVISSLYEMDDMQMESLNIKLISDEQLRKTTYISGVEFDNPLYFKSALIMFGPASNGKGLHEHQSFHRIDAKEFAMEIMLTFNEAHLGPGKIQVHVLVDLAEVENPAWKPVTNGLSSLLWKLIHEKCFGLEHSHTAHEALTKAEAIYKEAFSKQKNETRGLTYKRAVNELKILQESVKGVKEESLEALSKQYSDALAKQQKCLEEKEAINDSIKELDSESDPMRVSLVRDSDKNAKLAKLEAERSVLKKKRSKAESCIKDEGKRAITLHSQSRILEQSRIGNKSTDFFRSINDVSRLLEEMQAKMQEMQNIESAFEKAKKDLKDLMETPTRSALIKDPFQVSWLFPSHGGFFLYNGSSPIPPCKHRSHVIVLEKPITISQEQLDQFREFPSITLTNETKWKGICESMKKNENANESTETKSSGRDDQQNLKAIVEAMEKMPPQVPHLMALGNRSLWHNPKNIQFKDDDGFHMKSSTRRKLKESYQSLGCQPDKSTVILYVSFLIFILVNKIIL